MCCMMCSGNTRKLPMWKGGIAKLQFMSLFLFLGRLKIMSKNLFLFLVMAALVASAPMAAWGENCTNYQQRMQQARNEAQKNRAAANQLGGSTANGSFSSNYIAAANRLEQYAVQLGQACGGGSGDSSGMGYGGAGGGSGYTGTANTIQQFGQLFQLLKEQQAEERQQAAERRAEAQRAAQEQQQAERNAEEIRQEYLRQKQSEQRKIQQLNDAINAEIARDEINSQLDAQLQSAIPQKEGSGGVNFELKPVHTGPGICWDGSSQNKYGGCPDLVFPGPQKQGAADKVANASLNDQSGKAMAEDNANQRLAQLEQGSRNFLNTPANAPFTHQDALPVSATHKKASTEDTNDLVAAEERQSSRSLFDRLWMGVDLTRRQIKDATAKISAAMHQFPFPHLYKGAPGIVEDHLNVLDDYINRNFWPEKNQ